MLTSAPISELEPHLPLSPSSLVGTRARTYKQSRAITNAPHASTSRLSTPPKQSSDVSSCLSPSSAFYQVLTAQYQPTASPLVRRASLVGPRLNDASYDFVDSSAIATSSNTSDNRDGELAGDSATTSTLVGHRIYTPHGPWAWADGLSIDYTEELMPVRSGLTWSASIKSGTLGDRRITYISKRWNTSQQPKWLAFSSELALYKAESYLRSLQGDVLPWLIGVYVWPGAVSIAMEPPHHSFWIEASPDMPKVLKERCIAAFEKIHACGVLHGDVELRHMLIGGDGKVTIINFQKSRALVPNLDVNLLEATSADLKLEMRKVKYKLDYNGARQRESEKMLRNEERNRAHGLHNLEILRDEEVVGKGKGKEDIPEDDIIDPPVPIQDWNESWAHTTTDAPPTRFVIPGQTSENLEKEVRNFLTILDGLAAGSFAGTSTSNNDHRQVRFASEISSTRFINALPDEHVAAKTTSHSYGLRKRKFDGSLTSDISLEDNHLSKRPRLSDEPSISVSSSAEEEDEPIRLGLRTDPILVNYMADQSLDKDRFTPPRTPLVEDLAAPDVPSSSTSSGSRFPPIKIRDFAYESYDGPRGYYAPYPLMEVAVSLNRRQWIRGQTEQRRAEAALSHPRPQAEGIIRPLNSASQQSISDNRLIARTLALGTIREQAAPEEMQLTGWKRPRGDQESEMFEEDFVENDRRAAKARRVMKRADDSARQMFRQPSFGSLDVEYTRGRTLSRQPQPGHGHPQIVGPGAQEFLSLDRAVTTMRTVSSKYSTVGERMALATLGRLPPNLRVKPYPASLPSPSSSDAVKPRSLRRSTAQINTSASSRRPRTYRRGVPDVPRPFELQREQFILRSPSPTSEDEVEAILCQSPTRGSHSSTDNSLSRWVDFLLQWIP